MSLCVHFLWSLCLIAVSFSLWLFCVLLSLFCLLYIQGQQWFYVPLLSSLHLFVVSLHSFWLISLWLLCISLRSLCSARSVYLCECFASFVVILHLMVSILCQVILVLCLLEVLFASLCGHFASGSASNCNYLIDFLTWNATLRQHKIVTSCRVAPLTPWAPEPLSSRSINALP